MNKLFTKIATAFVGIAMAIGVGVAVGSNSDVKRAHAVTYEQLTSIANIDESAQYVLGVEGYGSGKGFHKSGTSSWGVCTTSDSDTPLYYTLKKGANNESFTAKTTISGTTYYLQVPTSNTFSMNTSSTAANTTLIIGTTKVSGTNYAVANSGTTDRHLRVNGTSGLRSYAGTTGSMAFFYKAVSSGPALSSIAVQTAPKTSYTEGEYFDPTGLVITRNYSDSTSDTLAYAGHTGDFTFSPTTSAALTTSDTSVTITHGGKSCSQAITVSAAPSGGAYTKITAAPTDWSGTYLLVYEDSSTAYVWTGVDAASCYATTTISNGSISKPSAAQTITIASMTGGYSVKVNGGTNSGKYIYGTSGSNALNFSSSAQVNTISYDSGVDFVSNTSHLRFNSASDNLRFRYFKSASYSSQKTVQLYKEVLPSVSITTSTPTVVYDGSNEQTITFTATVENFSDDPADITYGWYSDNSSVIDVTNAGDASTANLKVVGEGTANVHVYALGESLDEATSEDFEVTVNHEAVVGLSISGTGVSENTLSIGSNDGSAHTITVTLSPNAPTDKRVNIAHQAGTNGLFTKSASQITCSNGTGTFTLTGTGATSGTETFRISANTESSVKVDLVVTAFDESVTYYTVRYSTSVGTVSPATEQIEENGHPTLPNPTEPTHFTFNGWKYNDSIIDSTFVVTSDVTFTADWTEDTKYTVTYDANGGTVSPASESLYGGDHPTLPIPTKSGNSFDGWQINGEGEYITSSYTVNSAITLVAHWTQVTLITDVLTRESTGVTDGSTTYSAWSDVSSNSYAIYAGQSAGGNDSIQLRSNNSNSGVITTASGGKLKSVTVVFEGNTQSGRTINVYGKNSAYEAPTDLYDANEQGTLLGTIVNGTSTSVSVTGDYTYVGLCSASGAIYLSSVSIVWEGVAPARSYTVTYDGNGSDGGTTPVDANSPYNASATVTTLENTFTRTGYTFSSWNTAPDGSGSSYDEGAQFTISANTILYAIWEQGGGGGSATAARCYHLVESTDDLVAGAKYIIGSTSTIASHAMSTTQNSNNRGEETVTISNSIAAISSDGVQVVTLGGSTGAWTFAVSGGYLYAASSTANHLKTESEVDANGTWAISVSDGIASIVAQGSNSRNVMQYNSGSGLFACYASASQTGVSLYRLDFGETLLHNITCSGSGSYTIAEGYAWSDLKSVYQDLPSAEQTSLKTASNAGLVRYDYLVGKYGTSTFENFIGRTVTPIGHSSVILLTALGNKSTNTTIIIIVTVGIAAIAIGGYFLLRKKKED